jgi:hypothetical protein
MAPHRFQKGQSGNPWGRTRAMDRLAELVAAFEATHHRGPSPVELIHLRQAAKLAAAATSPRTNAEQLVRASNSSSSGAGASRSRCTAVEACRMMGREIDRSVDPVEPRQPSNTTPGSHLLTAIAASSSSCTEHQSPCRVEKKNQSCLLPCDFSAPARLRRETANQKIGLTTSGACAIRRWPYVPQPCSSEQPAAIACQRLA